MASIASPRPIPASGTSTPTISSRRTSLDTTRTASPSRPNILPAPARRNRAALRDYYNLKPTSDLPSSSASIASEDDSSSPPTAPFSELDKPDFNPSAYVQGLLEKEGLQAVLRTESGLLNEIRELDGERKALVYDNYSKLIAATDTIRGMRRNMEPLGASTGDLKGMVERVAGMAGGLSEHAEAGEGEVEKEVEEDQERMRRQRATVRWVGNAPRRLRTLVEDGQREEAERQWAVVERLLGKWEGVEGVQAIRDECLTVLKRDEDGDD